MNRIAVVILATTVLFPKGAFPKSIEPERTFPKGVYRQEGNCSKIIQNGKKAIDDCLPYIGVLAREYDRPEFMFNLTSGNLWVFVSSGHAVYSKNNRVIKYPISEMLDRESKKFILYKGECVITIGDGEEEIHCVTWKDHDRSNIAWEVIFNGNAVWQHNPSF